jgi:hypothetical protein
MLWTFQLLLSARQKYGLPGHHSRQGLETDSNDAPAMQMPHGTIRQNGTPTSVESYAKLPTYYFRNWNKGALRSVNSCFTTHFGLGLPERAADDSSAPCQCPDWHGTNQHRTVCDTRHWCLGVYARLPPFRVVARRWIDFNRRLSLNWLRRFQIHDTEDEQSYLTRLTESFRENDIFER